MKRVLFLCWSIMFFMISPIEGQTLVPYGYNKIGNEFWASGGAALAEQGLSASAINNPANIQFSSPTITVEGSWEPEVPFLFTNDHINGSTNLPSYCSIGYPLNDFSLEAGYCRSYHWHTRYQFAGYDGDSYGTYTFEENDNIHTIFTGCSWQPIDEFSFGITVNVDIISFGKFIYINSQPSTGVRLGAIFGTEFQPIDQLSFAATIHFPSSYTKIDTATDIVARSPLLFDLGTTWACCEYIKIESSVEYQGWDHVQGSDNLWQFHLGAVVSPMESLNIRAGYFTQQFSKTDDLSFLNQKFLTAGAAYKVNDQISTTVTYVTSKPFRKGADFVPGLYQCMVSFGATVAW